MRSSYYHCRVWGYKDYYVHNKDFHNVTQASSSRGKRRYNDNYGDKHLALNILGLRGVNAIA
jgi:hypothetical protein